MRADQKPADRSEHMLIGLLAAMALIGSFVLQPNGQGGICVPLPGVGVCLDLPQACISRRLLGLPCAGCGLTRSFVWISRGSVSRAIECNPLGPLIYLLAVAQLPYRAIEILQVWEDHALWKAIRGKLSLLTWLVIGSLLILWVVRLALHMGITSH
jgi:hypothetical protein